MPAPSAAWSLAYHDGNANHYQLASDGDGATFEYRPVSAAQSSSGTSSGGGARTAHLDAAQVAALWQQLGTLESTPALHAADRAMGTGAFALTEGGAMRKFLIASGPALAAFEQLVKSF